MNREFPAATLSEPVVGGPKNRGAIVSRWIVDADGDVLTGERAYDRIFNENKLVGPAPVVGNSTRPFSRFCSGSLAGPPDGFDRWIYFTDEEEGTPANTFDGKGGLAVAIADNALYTLPKLGRFAWENSLVQPNQSTRTVIMGMEDGPSSRTRRGEQPAVHVRRQEGSQRRGRCPPPQRPRQRGALRARSGRSREVERERLPSGSIEVHGH